jgi:hypothetical protein
MAKRHPVTGKLLSDNKSIPLPEEMTSNVTVVERTVERTEEPKQSEVTQAEELKELAVTIELEDVKKVEIVPEDEEGWTNIRVDSQKLSTFMECNCKFDYVFNKNLKSIEGPSKGMLRGSAVHIALLAYWKEIIASGDYQVATKSAIKSAKGFLDKELKFNSDDKLEVLQTILDFLKHIQTSVFVPVEVEKYFKQRVYEDPETKLRIRLDGRIDLIAKSSSIPLLPIDAKTESERRFYSQMSNQFKIYCIVCKTNLLGVQRIGFQTTVKPEDKFKLEILPFDQDVLEEFRTITLPYWIRQMILADQTKQYPMNTTSCINGGFYCQFSDRYNGGICNVSRSVREQKLQRYFVVGEPWDPEKVTE